MGEEDPRPYRVDGTVILALAGMITLLWSRWPVPLPGLNALELGMIGLLVGHIAFVQYRMMLAFSLYREKLSAQRSLKTVVLLTAVLILTYGLYVPKSWRRSRRRAARLAPLRHPRGAGPATGDKRVKRGT
jgi:eukaryotic-like serine/threonine-protein kinase